MKSEKDGERKGLDHYIAEVEARQRNVLWPDVVQNAKSVDQLMLLGSARLSLVQKLGMWLFAITFIGLGFVLLAQMFKGGSFLGVFVGLCFVLVGLIVLANSLRRFKSGNAIRPNDPKTAPEAGDQS